MTEFKQIIGRGTRLREKEGKMSFTVMDFRNVTRLFADPDWDGPIEIDPDYPKKKGPGPGPYPPPPPPPPPPTYKPIVDKNGCSVRITNKTVSVYDTDGKLLKQENIIDYTKSNILGYSSSLEQFIKRWSEEDKKSEITELLKEQGIDLEALKEEQNMTEVDDFDFICHIAYGAKPLTRRERANNVKKRDFFSKYSGAAREVLEALLDKYMNTGLSELNSADVLKLDPINKFGKPAKIAQLFGGKDEYFKAVEELKNNIYKVG